MVDHELDELKREFLSEAREKVAEMQSTLANSRDASARERLVYLAHQLKGSGGSYGYQRISTDAAELEKALESLSSAGDSGLEAKIRDYVVSLGGEIERCASELTTT